jgi:hypothetical protein
VQRRSAVAGQEDERDLPRIKHLRHRIHGLAVEIDIKHRRVETLARSDVERRSQIPDRPDYLLAGRFQYVRDQRRNQVVVFNDQYPSPLPHFVFLIRIYTSYEHNVC